MRMSEKYAGGVLAFTLGGGMTSYDSGLSDAEIARIEIGSNEKLVVERIDVQGKGGGSNSNFSANVYDETNSTKVGSQTLGGVTRNPGDVSGQASVLVRVTNNDGSPVEADVTVVCRMVST